MRHNSTSFSSSVRQFSSVSGSLVALASLAFFAASGSNLYAEKTLYCRVLRSGRGDQTIYARKWVTADQGGLGGLEGDYKVYPFLVPYNRASATSAFIYWPKGYTSDKAPVVYTVVGPVSLRIEHIPDDQVDNVANSIASMFPDWQSSAAVSGISVSYDTDGTPIINATTYPPGRIVGNAVSTYDSSGRPILALPDSTGFVPGYRPSADGSFSPVWYDTSTGGENAVVLDSLSHVQSSQLSYDETTGLYSFDIPDYSAQLTAIHETLQNKRFTIDNIELPSPEVTVNVSPPEVNVPAPEVTVNVSPPEVNVPAPEVTVNVPTPEVTVNVPTPEVTVNVDNDYSEVVASLDQIVEASYTYPTTNDFSQETFTEEEQGLINTAKGWETNIPVLGEAFDLGLDILIGRIPQMNKTYQLLNMKLLGYDVVCDLEPYKDTIMIFRAFFLLCELIWFFWVLWHDIMNALKV